MPTPAWNAIGGMPLIVTGTGGGASPSDIYGSRVGPIPGVNGPSLNSVYPNLSGTNSAASGALMSELTGHLSPQTLAAINDAAASFGVSSGMPGSGLAMNRYPRDVGLATEDLIHRGIGDYASLVPSVSATQTVSPAQSASLNTEINATNAVNAAAPNPASAGTYAQQLFDRYLGQMSRPSGGTGSTMPWYAQAVNAGGSGWGPAAGVTTTRTNRDNPLGLLPPGGF